MHAITANSRSFSSSSHKRAVARRRRAVFGPPPYASFDAAVMGGTGFDRVCFLSEADVAEFGFVHFHGRTLRVSGRAPC